jgi:hypothetical protein
MYLFVAAALLSSRTQRNRIQPTEWWGTRIDLLRGADEPNSKNDNIGNPKKRERDADEEYDHPWKRQRKDQS